MSFRREPNPNRNHPVHCPYCGETTLFPNEEGEFAWLCKSCQRVFSVMFHGQDDGEHEVRQSPSSNEALQNSLRKRGHNTARKEPEQKSSFQLSSAVSSSVNVLGGKQEDTRDPEVSPPGTKGTSELSLDTARRNEELVEKWADKLYDADAGTILEWAHEHAPGNILVTLSMENTVLAELASQHAPEADFLFLDTEYHFGETLEVAEKVDQRYPQRLVTAKALLSRQEQDSVYGRNLYRSNPAACCRMRKVEPLADALSPYVGWVTGLRRDDGPTRAQAPALSLDGTGRLKISPIITWTLQETEDYIEDKDLIIHPLTKQGYPSIGCATCTMPVAEGEDPRAGRWAGQAKTECGLHT